MKYLILIAVLAVSSVSAEADFKKFFGKYAAMKMFSSCFGEDYMTEWTHNFSVAVSFCSQQPADDFLRDLPLDEYPLEQVPVPPSFPSPDYLDPTLVPGGEDALASYLSQGINPYGQGAGVIDQPYPTTAGIYDLPSVMAALNGNLSSPVLLVPLPLPLLQGLGQHQGFYRQKRQTADIDAGLIERVYQGIRNKAGNFTCIMKYLNYFDENLDVNVGYQMEQIANSEVDAELKADIFESISDCIKFASCKPLNRKSLMPPAVQRAISFMKCESKMNLASCVKNDLLRQQNKFDIQALDELPSGSNMDIGDKMLAILYGKYNQKGQ